MEDAVIPSSELAEWLDQLKRALNITSTKHDYELLEDYLIPAFGLAQSVAGADFYPGTATEIVTAVGVLKHYPVTSCSATYLGSPATVTVSSAGVVTGACVGTSVTYSYGQDEPTPEQRKGVILIAMHGWQTQRGASAVPGPLDDNEGGGAGFGFSFSIPDRARDYLRPPSAVSGIA